MEELHMILVYIIVSYYLDSFLKFIKGVTKESYIRCFDLSENDLEEIIKTSYHVERLIFRTCDIHCSGTLDFSCSEKSNIKTLSFDYWGGNTRNSDFNSNASWFENIIEGIAKSGIKESLQTIDIRECNLDKDEIQKMLIKYELKGVTIVDTGADPAEGLDLLGRFFKTMTE